MSATLPDLLQPGLSAVFCGINPGLSAARVGHHFAGRGNRFWSVLHLAGFIPIRLSADEDARLLEFGYGITAAVSRASAGVAGVHIDEFHAGLRVLETKIQRWRPRSIAFLGKPAWAAHMKSASFGWGRQPHSFAGADTWVLPNPSGLNRHFSLDDLVVAYSGLRRALDMKEQK